MPTQRTFIVVGALALAVGASACSTASLTARSSSPTGSSSQSLDTTLPQALLTAGDQISQPISIPDHKVTLLPATGQTPSVSAADALSAAKTLGLYPQAMGTVTPAIKLAILDDEETRNQTSSGTTVPVFKDVLVWVVSYAGIKDEIGAFGPSRDPSASPQASPIPTSGLADLVFFIDAVTGKPLTAINDGVPVPGVTTTPLPGVTLGPDGKPISS